MLIYLTGFMGAGKSTAGKKLAGLLGYSFVDLDVLIETETKKTMSELFATGQDKFREIEAHVLRKTESLTNSVIASGGGTPCFHENMQWMNNQGLTIYLKMSPGSLFHRLAPSKASRPLIAGKSDVELMEFIMETLKDRERFYRQSGFIMKGENLDVKILFEELKKLEPQLR